MKKMIKKLIFLSLLVFLFLSFKFHNTDKVKIGFYYKSEEYKNDYCVIYNYWQAKDEYVNGNHITFVTHSTIQYIPYLEQQVKQWDGGISVALYIPTPNNMLNTVDIMETQIYLRVSKFIILTKCRKERSFSQSSQHYHHH